MTLDELPLGRAAVVTGIDREALGEGAARRLRAMGLDIGASVELLHRGVLWSRDPLAIRLGRMTLGLRSVQAAAISVEAAA
ncbi:MAG: ferrous iron transport protein A [Sphingomonadales bacterium]|nr:ferrous iron transport protein A [Sphingomonadales bacterium]